MIDAVIDGQVNFSLENLPGSNFTLDELIGTKVKVNVRKVKGTLTNIATLTLENKSSQVVLVITEKDKIGNLRPVVVLESGLVLEQI